MDMDTMATMDTDMDIPLPTAMDTILARGLLMPSQKLMLTMAALDMDMDVVMDMATTSARGPLMLLLRPMLTTAASDMVMDVDTAMATVLLDTMDTAMLLMLTMVMAMDFITNLLNYVKMRTLLFVKWVLT